MSDINPMNRKCCANCHCLMVRNDIESNMRTNLTFQILDECPFKEHFRMFKGMELSLSMQITNQYVNEVTSLFDFVCDEWEGRGEPLNLSHRDRW